MSTEWQGFYSDRQVSRLAHIPLRTLYRWRSQGIIKPSVYVIDADGKREEGYTYADLAIIKLLRALKVKQLNLHSIVMVLRHLYDRFGLPDCPGWANAHVYVIGKKVFAQKPDDWDTTLATKHGQKVEMRVLGELIEEEAALLVPKPFSDYVEINLSVVEGLPVIRDTRVPTYMLKMMNDQGNSVDELAELYSPISAQAIKRGIDFELSLDQALKKAPKVRAVAP
ncbi:MAG: DUF433 domain-containing protein [Chloroflexi bacterium]|nr:DUF433 domain-containing protein [Chloroflexota bacterium]